MKTYKELNEENMFSVQEIKTNADQAAKFIEKELNRMFPGNTVVVSRNSIGTDTIIGVKYANVPKGSSHVDFLNATANISLMSHLTTKFGEKVPMSSFSMDLNTKSHHLKDVKYRKIKSGNLAELGKKVVAWFKKNEKRLK